MSDSDTQLIRFSNLELGDAPVISVTAQVPIQDVSSPKVGEVDPHRADVARRERETFNEATGANLSGEAGEGPDGGTFYDEGTIVVNPDVPLQSRREWERQPNL